MGRARRDHLGGEDDDRERNMGRARRDHLGGEDDEQEREGEATEDNYDVAQQEAPPPSLEFRYVYTPAHAELQYRKSGGEWAPVPYVKRDQLQVAQLQAQQDANATQAAVTVANNQVAGQVSVAVEAPEDKPE